MAQRSPRPLSLPPAFNSLAFSVPRSLAHHTPKLRFVWNALLVASIILYVYRISFFGINLSLFRILFIFWFLVLLKDLLLRKIILRKSYLFLLSIILMISSIQAIDAIRMENLSWYGKEIFNHMTNLLLVFLVVTYFDTEQKLNSLIRMFIAGSVFALLISLFTLISGHLPFETLLRPFYSEYMQEHVYLVRYRSSLRLASSFFDPNFYGVYICLVIIFCLYYLHFIRRSPLVRLVLYVNLCALIFTMSRTSLVGVLVLFLISLCMIRGFASRWVPRMIFLLLLGLVMVLVFSDRLANSDLLFRLYDPESLIDRMRYIDNGLEAFVRNPILGVGTEGLLSDEVPVPSTHIVYLSLLAKHGILGFFVYSIFLFYPLFYVFSIKKRLAPGFQYLILCVQGTLLTIFFAYDLFKFLEFEYLVFGIVYSVILNGLGHKEQDPSSGAKKVRGQSPIPCAAS